MSDVMNTAQAGLNQDPVLSTIAQGIIVPGHIGFKFLPRVQSGRNGQLIQFGDEAIRRYNLDRAPGAATQSIQIGFDGIPFVLKQQAVKCPVPIEHLEQAKTLAGVDLSRRAVSVKMKVLAQQLELEQARLITSTSSYKAAHVENVADAQKWSSPESDPIKDILDANEVIRQATGVRANKLGLSPKAALAIKTHPKVVERFKSFALTIGFNAGLAELLEVKEVVVAEAIVANDDGSKEDIWGRDAWLAYVPESTEHYREEPAFGYTYTLGEGPRVSVPRWDDDSESYIHRLAYDRNAYIVSPDSGFLFKGVV